MTVRGRNQRGGQQRCWVHPLREMDALVRADPLNGELACWEAAVHAAYREALAEVAALTAREQWLWSAVRRR